MTRYNTTESKKFSVLTRAFNKTIRNLYRDTRESIATQAYNLLNEEVQPKVQNMLRKSYLEKKSGRLITPSYGRIYYRYMQGHEYGRIADGKDFKRSAKNETPAMDSGKMMDSQQITVKKKRDAVYMQLKNTAPYSVYYDGQAHAVVWSPRRRANDPKHWSYSLKRKDLYEEPVKYITKSIDNLRAQYKYTKKLQNNIDDIILES